MSARVPLSVVIPTFDTVEMTLRCCRSVMAGLLPGCEVIVSDDGSSDGTAPRIREELPAVRIERSETNRGFAAAANRGIAAASGSVVLLLNSDTVVPDGALAAMAAAFDDDPRLGIAGPQLVGDDGLPQWSAGPTPTLGWLAVMVSGAAGVARPFRRDRPGPSRREVDWVTGAAMAFRRDVWLQAGPLREDFHFYAQDLDFCLRARAGGWRVKMLGDVTIEHLHGGTVAAATALAYSPEMLWTDLLAWGRGHYGESWARRARRAMIAAAALRVTARRCVDPFRPRSAREIARAATRQFAQGYEVLRRSPS